MLRVLLRRSLLALLVLLIAAGLPLAAREDHERARRLMEAGRIVPLEQILDDARSRHPGRLLEAELKSKRGRLRYEIELLDSDGVVWELKYDAATGELIEEEQDD